ncbi:MAG: hypothetical protein FWF90_12070 [Promicromonosporaceae bacterium]|nr:hypothetical protein [Promicromonosporaceae bacterium]
MAIPDEVCWGLSDTPSRSRLVTHTRVPGVRWRLRLPSPMPASWVGLLLLSAFLLFFVVFVVAVSAGISLPAALLVGCAAAWLLAQSVRPFAGVRLRREAFAVLSVLAEDEAEQ